MSRTTWTERLPLSLQNTAYYAPSTAEPAWPKPDALKVLSHLADLRISIFGVEVWIPTDSGPLIPTNPYYGLSIERDPGEGSAQFLIRSVASATDFIRKFRWDRGDLANAGAQPYFNFTPDAE